MTKIYLLDGDQLAVLTRVKKRLYDEMHRLGADERRDLANMMDAVLHHVETYGALVEDPEPMPTLDVIGAAGGKATVTACTCASRTHGVTRDVQCVIHGDPLAALRDLRQNANRLCDRNLGGTYEEDCRRSIAQADVVLARAVEVKR